MITKYNTYIKENKFERKVLTNSDDIYDYIKKYFGLPNNHFIINDDLSVDVNLKNSRISIRYKDNKYNCLPINFRNFEGDLDLSNNNFISLDGCPKIIFGNFDCRSNLLTSLKNSPQVVHGWFCCNHNNLKTLENGPVYVEKTFSCTVNPLESLKGLPKTFNNLECLRNYRTLKDINDIPINYFEKLISDDVKNWLFYLDKEVIKRYLDLNINNIDIIKYKSSLIRLIQHFDLDDYKFIIDANNFDLI